MTAGPPSSAKVLCVDDEPAVLRSLKLRLERYFTVDAVGSASDALEMVATGADYAVVVSDMNMPGMDGITFLSRVREIAPDISRILLTGSADLPHAIAAVNDGQVFRFLTKPCDLATLYRAVDAGVTQHRLITAERILLEQTLNGSVQALTDILSLANPLYFGRATRLKTLTTELASALGWQHRWQVEMAAALSQLACVGLPPETAEKLYYGRDLDPDDAAMVARMPELIDRLLVQIPRLEVVHDILLALHGTAAAAIPHTAPTERDAVHQGARLLRLVIDFDVLESQALDTPSALAVLRGRQGAYDAPMLAALEAVRGDGDAGSEIRELPADELRAGMILTEDMVLSTGLILASHGNTVTPGLLERLRNLPRGAVREPIRAQVRRTVML